MGEVAYRVIIVSIAALLTGPVLADEHQARAQHSMPNVQNGSPAAMDNGVGYDGGDSSVINPDSDEGAADAPDDDGDSDQDSPDDSGGDDQDSAPTIPA